MKLAHLSDLHALSLDGVHAWQFLNKRTPGLLNLKLNRQDKYPVRLFAALMDDLNREVVDQVVVTGDLTNLSLRPEFRLARQLLDRLTLGPSNVTVVPGNHDVYTLDARWQRPFYEYLAPYASSDGAVAVAFPLVRVRGPLAIIGISTARPSPPPFADGRLGRRQLAALERALAAQAGKFRVLLLHHPPYTNRHAFLRGLRDRQRLQEVLARVGAELVLHGHEHRDLRQTLPGPNGEIPVIGVGSGTFDDARPERRARYNVYTIEEGRLTSVVTRVHDPARERFVAFATPPTAPAPIAPAPPR